MAVLMRKKSKEKAKKFEDLVSKMGIDLRQSFKEMKVKLIAAFSSKDEAYGLDYIKKLQDISKKYNYNVLTTDIVYNTGEKGAEEFSQSYLEGRVFTDGERYFICGPPRFNRQIPISLENMKIDKTKIHLV